MSNMFVGMQQPELRIDNIPMPDMSNLSMRGDPEVQLYITKRELALKRERDEFLKSLDKQMEMLKAEYSWENI